MKKRNLVALAVVLVLLCNFLGVNSTGAWFVSGGAFSDNRYETAQVMYLPALQTETRYEGEVPKYGRLIKGTPEGTTDIKDVVFLVPGENLIDSGERQVDGVAVTYPGLLSLENFSSASTNVRVQMNVSLSPLTIAGIEDPVIAQAQFEWVQKPNSDIYFFGMKDQNQIFMPLLQVEFANRSTTATVLPAGYDVGKNDMAGTYLWKFQPAAQNDELPYWDLVRGGNISIPRSEPGKTQFYNVITNVSLATTPVDDTSAEAQELFNNFFSSHFAGHDLKIQIMYYAKQEAGMNWIWFGQEEINLIPQSRDKVRP